MRLTRQLAVKRDRCRFYVSSERRRRFGRCRHHARVVRFIVRLSHSEQQFQKPTTAVSSRYLFVIARRSASTACLFRLLRLAIRSFFTVVNISRINSHNTIRRTTFLACDQKQTSGQLILTHDAKIKTKTSVSTPHSRNEASAAKVHLISL